MAERLPGKVAIVTGGASGFGEGIARRFAQEGARVAIADLNEDAAQKLAKELGGLAVRADISRGPDVSALVQAVRAQWGEIDILVNNAGAIPPGDLLAVDDAAWRRAWDLKVFGFISLCRAAYPQMKARKSGVIVNVIGAAGEQFPSAYIAGAAGNASLMAFTRALGKQAPADGLRVVAINPGPVETERLVMLQRDNAAKTLGDPERWRELTKGMPFGRPAKPEEIGYAVAFLASERSGYTSGTVLTINGGG
jgi:NAD(P)-dependent dehydrogenase (short-subunit alcohol dehydrogenase family)